MNAINYCEYESEQSGAFVTEASLCKKGFDVRQEHAFWPSAGTALIETRKGCLIRMHSPLRASGATKKRTTSVASAATFSTNSNHSANFYSFPMVPSSISNMTPASKKP
ncbi:MULTISPECIES: hypothetical protein [unclassified Pseudomonas]|jgi:hypothetical protein|uniref:hypothetical protein n=1 Tax=unclassified Pseudomonas TaxID=196821 RepID=UPI001CE15A12|nr:MULTISPECIES: hypothetical protein [unclassified Pseudomonas]